MKKLFFLVVTLATSIFLSSQTALAPSSSDIGEELPDTVTQSFDLVLDNCPPEMLMGEFSVSATQKVRFSRGNLQYLRSTRKWFLAAHQYDMIGVDNMVGGAISFDPVNGYSRIGGTVLADRIDLFCWSGNTGSAKWGIDTVKINGNYSGDFADWGQNIGDGTIWRTLTYDEWYYLRYTRANADNLIGVARINLTEDGSEYTNGLILLPDNWVCPAGVTFKSGFSSEHNVQAYADYQTFTLDQWSKLEKSSAVFLPASGLRDGTDMNYVGYRGYYWSATPSGEDYARSLGFRSGGAGVDDRSRYYGRAVRLIQDVK